MYNFCLKVINRRRYELTSLLRKLDMLYFQDSLTKEEYDDLVSRAQSNADPVLSLDLLGKIQDLDARITALEQVKNSPIESYPDFVEGKWYKKGNRISFEKKQYECVAPAGVTCVWNPRNKPDYWEEIVSTVPDSPASPEKPSTEEEVQVNG